MDSVIRRAIFQWRRQYTSEEEFWRIMALNMADTMPDLADELIVNKQVNSSTAIKSDEEDEYAAYEATAEANNAMLKDFADEFGGKFHKATYGQDGQNEPDNVTIESEHGSLYMYEDGNGLAFINSGESYLFKLIRTLNASHIRRVRNGIMADFTFSEAEKSKLERFLAKFTSKRVTASTLPEYRPSGKGFKDWYEAYQNASDEDQAEMWSKLNLQQKQSVNAYKAYQRHGERD
jgi:hypothetical protein